MFKLRIFLIILKFIVMETSMSNNVFFLCSVVIVVLFLYGVSVFNGVLFPSFFWSVSGDNRKEIPRYCFYRVGRESLVRGSYIRTLWNLDPPGNTRSRSWRIWDGREHVKERCTDRGYHLERSQEWFWSKFNTYSYNG